eukprot:s4681_g1.t1
MPTTVTDGHINYTEFVAALLQVQGKLIDDVVYHAFQIFDLNGDGHISLDELRSMLSGGGPLSAVLGLGFHLFSNSSHGPRYSKRHQRKIRAPRHLAYEVVMAVAEDWRRGKAAWGASSDDEWELLVQVQSVAKGDFRTFEVGMGQNVGELKSTIRAAGGWRGSYAWGEPVMKAQEDHQKLLLGDRVLEDDEHVSEVLTSDALHAAGGYLRLAAEPVLTEGSSCSCAPCKHTVAGFVDYFGTCQHCGKAGGAAARCQLCSQTFPSLYVLDLHLKFVHSLQLKQLQRPDRQSVLPDGKTVEQALQDLDTSQDGVVSFDEFKAYLTRESQGASQNKSPEDSIEVDVRQSLDVVLQQLASLVGRPEAELVRQSKRLAQEHWITTVSDLKQLNSVDWPRLGLPLKLEQVLRRQIAAASDMTIQAVSRLRCRLSELMAHVNAASETKTLMLVKTAGAPLGFTVRYNPQALVVTSVLTDSTMEQWNHRNPNDQIVQGTRIKSINGERSIRGMLSELQKATDATAVLFEVFREIYEDLLEQHLSCVSTGTGIYGDYL